MEPVPSRVNRTCRVGAAAVVDPSRLSNAINPLTPQAHIITRLAIRVRAVPQIVHPALTVALARNDCTGFGPLRIPCAL